MIAMSEMSKNMKVLGRMIKRENDFDMNAAQAAVEAIGDLAAQTPGLFQSSEMDPKSEAKLAIWEGSPPENQRCSKVEFSWDSI